MNQDFQQIGVRRSDNIPQLADSALEKYHQRGMTRPGGRKLVRSDVIRIALERLLVQMEAGDDAPE